MSDECVLEVIKQHQNGNNECGYAGSDNWCKVNPNMLTLEDAWMACSMKKRKEVKI